VYLGYEILNGVTHSINYSVVIGGNSLNSFWEPSTPTKVMIHLLWLRNQVLRDLTTGNTNTAIGYKSGHTLSNGINNTFLGGLLVVQQV
jgi:hypothetical protein